MTKYHINPETGRAGQCKAQSAESCKFSVESGTVIAHYETKDEAKAAYEKLNENKTLNSVKKTKTSPESKVNTLQENRTKLSGVNSRVERLTANLQARKSKLIDLNKSLSLDKSKEERDAIYEKIKKQNEDILVLDKNRKDSLKEQKELAQTIEKQQREHVSEINRRDEEDSRDTAISEMDERISFNERFFRGGCGASGGC